MAKTKEKDYETETTIGRGILGATVGGVGGSLIGDRIGNALARRSDERAVIGDKKLREFNQKNPMPEGTHAIPANMANKREKLMFDALRQNSDHRMRLKMRSGLGGLGVGVGLGVLGGLGVDHAIRNKEASVTQAGMDKVAAYHALQDQKHAMLEKAAFLFGEQLTPEQIAAMHQAAAANEAEVADAVTSPSLLSRLQALSVPAKVGIGAGALAGLGGLAYGATELAKTRNGAKGISHEPAGFDQTAMDKEAYIAPILSAAARLAPRLLGAGKRAWQGAKTVGTRLGNTKAVQGAEKLFNSRGFTLASGGLMLADGVGTLAGAGQKVSDNAATQVPRLTIPNPPTP